jgi:hypothetical protein
MTRGKGKVAVAVAVVYSSGKGGRGEEVVPRLPMSDCQM